jgi:cobalt-zinc-cadmium efflux system protein
MKDQGQAQGIRIMTHTHTVPAPTGCYLVLGLVLTLAFVAAETVAGYFANSLALLSDAGHNFADALALLFSWYALRVSRRPADPQRTFGSYRAGILAALVNAVSLVVMALFIFWEAVQRLRSPEPVASGPMIVVAAVAVVLNATISVWLHGGAQQDLNVRSAYLHMLGDAVSALGVVVAGVLVVLTGATAADPVASLLIGGLILWSSWGILTEAVNVLMEAAPKHLDVTKLAESIEGSDGVLNVHDLHVWTVGSGFVACSCHIVVAEQCVRSGQQVQRAVADMLRERFGVAHTTIQVEVEACHLASSDCALRAARPPHADQDNAHEDRRIPGD